MNESAPKDLYEELDIRTPLPHAAHETYLHILRTADLLSGEAERLLSAYGLSGSQYNALRIVGGGAEQGTPVLAIAKRMITRDPDMTRIVDRLEKAGLVTRHRCDADRRVWYVRTTDEGRKLLKTIRPEIDALHASQLSHLTPEQQRMLSELLFEARKPHLKTS